MGRKSAEDMDLKVRILRQITGDRPFAIRDLPDMLHRQLDYSSKQSLYMSIQNLVTGKSQCGCQLVRVRHGEYAWLNSAGGVIEPVQPVTLPTTTPVKVKEVLIKEPQQPSDWQKVVEENQRLAEDNKKLRETVSQNQEYIKYVENENVNLTEKLRLAQEEEKQKKAGRQELVQQLSSTLPKAFLWQTEKGEIIYKNKFLEELAELPQEDRKRVIWQLEVLGKNGSSYPSLQSKKIKLTIPYSPSGCMASRGTDEIRFTWQKDGGLVVYWLYRKGDSRVRESEC